MFGPPRVPPTEPSESAHSGSILPGPFVRADLKCARWRSPCGGARGFAEPRGNRLLAGDRDHTAAAEVVERQATAVRHALAADGGGVPPVRGALCTPDAIDLPPFAWLRLHEVVVDGPEAVAYLAARSGELTPEQVLRTARRLERAFPRV